MSRARLRKTRRGAALFIVAMTLAVLASVGVYALRAASLEVATAGYERQSMQAHYLAEYGVLSMAGVLDQGMVGIPQQWLAEANAKCQSSACTSIPSPYFTGVTGARGTSAETGCINNSGTTLTLMLQPAGGTLSAVVQGPDGGVGGLGASTIQGTFAVDIDTPRPGPFLAGYQANSPTPMLSYLVPIVSLGYVGNDVTAGSATPGSVGIEVQQAVLVSPPMKKFAPSQTPCGQ